MNVGTINGIGGGTEIFLGAITGGGGAGAGVGAGVGVVIVVGITDGVWWIACCRILAMDSIELFVASP